MLSVSKIKILKNDILGKEYSLSIAFVDENKSREINKKYRKKDRPTNVLSFALYPDEGEILLCKSVIKKEAKNFDKTFEEWLGLLVIHGMLHLKGHEHSSTMGRKRMENAEKKYDQKYFNWNRRRNLDNTNRGGESLKGEKNPKVIGISESETLGMRHGYVVDFALAVSSIKKAVDLAQKASGIRIKRAFISVSGVSLRGEFSSGSVIISKANGEVTSLDINKALQDCEDNLNLNNKKVIQIFPVSFRLDGKEVLGRIEGMRGTKLEIKAMFVTYSIQHLEDLVAVMAAARVETIDVIASPVALSQIALSEKQKIVGVALVDIGHQTTSLSVFENGLPMAIHTFSIGSSDITNDIALGFKIPLEAADSLKLGNLEESFSKKKLEEIIEARISDIFELIDNHLKKIKRNELLPAGIVFVGGGANILGLEDLSKVVLKLPSSLGSSEIFGNSKTKLRDSAWFTALSLVISGRDYDDSSEGSLSNLFKDLKNAIKSSIKQLTP